MTRSRRMFLGAGTILLGVIALFPRAAEARGRFGIRGAIVVRGVFGGPFLYGYPYCGFSPYWGPCYGPNVAYGPYTSNGFDMGMAAAAGIGAVDLNVKPGEAEVWVDGRFMAEARNLDGGPGFLWLRDGAHQLVIYKGGFRTFDEKILVQPGRKLDLKVRLEKGESQPPGTRPSGKVSQAG
jgi:PEGA domain